MTTQQPTEASNSTQTFDYVVLGGGNAAGYVARAFVQKSPEGVSLAIVSNEAVAPYERPALSKGFLTGQAKLPGFHTCVGVGGERQEPDWYSQHNITLLTNSLVTSLSLPSSPPSPSSPFLLSTASGHTIAATKALILATGSEAIRLTRNPGHDLANIHTLRTHADGLALLESVKDAKEIVIVGGGYIGMECGAAIASQGKHVTLVFPESHLMERLFTEEMASHYEKLYESKGVTLIKKALCTEFLGTNGHVTSCRLNTGVTLPCDAVIVGVGAVPAVQLVQGKVDMAERGGVLVDSHFQTSVPGLYAIGDVAAFPLKKYSRIQRVEHVTHARQSAAHVIETLLSPSPPSDYDYLPHFYSRIFHLNWKFWGDNVGNVIVVGDLAAPKLLAVWVGEGGEVNGVFLESGSEGEFEIARLAALRQGKVSVEGVRAAGTVEAALALLA